MYFLQLPAAHTSSTLFVVVFIISFVIPILVFIRHYRKARKHTGKSFHTHVEILYPLISMQISQGETDEQKEITK
jgi:uncharacterized membrane protein